MSPETALLIARYRLLAGRRPDLLLREPWYAREGERIRRMARLAGVDEGRAVKAAAVLSPAVQWEGLMSRLPLFLHHKGAGLPDPAPTFPGYRRNVEKAWQVLDGRAEPSGPKVARFARNLAGEEGEVTVDRWAARAAGLPESGGRAWYARVETAYREAARAVGLSPSRFQAVLWEGIREGALTWGELRPAEGSQDAPGSTITGQDDPGVEG